jgi:hypothetical protein
MAKKILCLVGRQSAPYCSPYGKKKMGIAWKKKFVASILFRIMCNFITDVYTNNQPIMPLVKK